MSTGVVTTLGDGPTQRHRWPDARLRKVGTMLSILAVVSAPATLIMIAVAGQLSRGIENYSIINTETTLVYGLLVLVLVRAQPRNRLVWFFVLVSVSMGLVGLTSGVVELVARDQGVGLEQIDTDGWPAGLATVVPLVDGLWVIGNFGLPTFGLLLAPDGRLPSGRWRPLAIVAALNLVGFWLAMAYNWPVQGGDPELQSNDTVRSLLLANYLVLFVLIPLSYASLVVRYRRSDPTERRRLRWILVGGALLVLAFFVEVSLSDVLRADYFLVVFYPILAVAFGLAIWRDQLFDVDAVISRTVVYGSMVAIIGATYVAVVFGLGALAGDRLDDSPVLPLVATAAVALVVQPFRSRIERWASRLVFGRRASPYEVLSEFTKRVAATDDQLLADVARSVVDGTTATAATIWRLDDGLLFALSSWPADDHALATAPLPIEPDTELQAPGADLIFAIEHEGRLIGALGLAVPAGETLPPGDRSLIIELSAGIGLALHNRDLSGELQGRVDELRASRRRLVAAQDTARHRLERNLHDGAQQRLVAVKVRLSIAQQMAAKADLAELADEVADLSQQADDAIDSLRDVVRGIYPPLLESEGLTAALASQLDRSSLTIDLDAQVTNRHPREIEATAYFAILETIAATEAATATGTGTRTPVTDPVGITVSDDETSLRFEVTTSTLTEPLPTVEERIDAVGGTVQFGPTPVVLAGDIPLAPLAPLLAAIPAATTADPVATP